MARAAPPKTLTNHAKPRVRKPRYPGTKHWTYRITQTEDKLEIEIRRMKAHSVDEEIEGAIDNKAGYGTAEGAKQVEAFFRAMRSAGHMVYFDPDYSWGERGPTITLSWAIYGPHTPYSNKNDPVRYGSPKVTFYPEDPGVAIGAAKVLAQIGVSIEKMRREALDFKLNRKQTYKIREEDIRSSDFRSPTAVVKALESKPWLAVRTEEFTRPTSPYWNRTEQVEAHGHRPFFLTDSLFETFEIVVW